jgi:polyhydroxyalkanoate synthesis regulator phasin
VSGLNEWTGNQVASCSFLIAVRVLALDDLVHKGKLNRHQARSGAQ